MMPESIPGSTRNIKDVFMDSFVDVHMRPSEKIVHRYGDMLLGVFFLKESTFTVQEGIRRESRGFSLGHRACL